MKNMLAIMGVATMLALSITMFLIFTVAYLSPAKTVRVQINNYGEADSEMIFLSAILPLNILSTFVIVNRLAGKKEENRTIETFEYKRDKEFKETY